MTRLQASEPARVGSPIDPLRDKTTGKNIR